MFSCFYSVSSGKCQDSTFKWTMVFFFYPLLSSFHVIQCISIITYQLIILLYLIWHYITSAVDAS